MAPELFDPEIAELDSSRPSKASDIWAFGMVVYEVSSQVISCYVGGKARTLASRFS
jgi:hypothetical protein